MNGSIRKGVSWNRCNDGKGTDLGQESVKDGGLVGRRQSPRPLLLLWGILGLVLSEMLTRGRAVLHLGIGNVALR
jgi:hypothetical protein